MRALRRRRARWLAGLAIASFAVALARNAAAQNHREVPIGGRTASMGGAGVAAGNDSAMPYLNPAGLAGVPADVFAVSASVYGYTQRSIGRFFHPNGFDEASLGPTSVTEESLSAKGITDLPSSVMYMRHVRVSSTMSYVLGVSLVIPSASDDQIVGSFHAVSPRFNGSIGYASSVASGHRDYYVGPSWAVAFGDWLRLGASAYTLYARSYASVSVDGVTQVSGGSFAVGEVRTHRAEESWATAFVPVVGAQLRVWDKLWFGFGVAAPSLHLAGRVTRTTEATNVGDSPAFRSSTSTLDGNQYSDRPLRVDVGVAWDDRKSFSVAADLHWYAARPGAIASIGDRSATEIQSGELTRTYTQRFVDKTDFAQAFDVSIGAELALGKVLALRVGFFTDAAARKAPSQPTRANLNSFRVSRIGASLGLGLTLGSFDTTLGAVYARSTGEFYTADVSSTAALAAGGSVVAVDTTANSVLFVISGAVSAEQAKKVIDESSPIGAPSLP